MKIINVVGARPNFMKIAPLLREMRKNKHFKSILLHTGQHYDYEMSKIFFKDLEIPKPDIHLGIGSGSHADQTGRIMMAFEKVVFREKPGLVLLVGDVNSTLACALVASKLSIPIAHVEAGLRSFDRTMPEEINRFVTDSLSDYLFTPTRTAIHNLQQEGIQNGKIHYVGNIMMDTLYSFLNKKSDTGIVEYLHLKSKNYVVLTLHRPENVDHRKNLKNIILGLKGIHKIIPIVFPIHGRTKKRIKEFGFSSSIKKMTNLKIIQPLGYTDFITLMKDSLFVMTDSGGIQEETTVLKVPCLTLRKNTERPETVSIGSNTLVGTHPESMISESLHILDGDAKTGDIPELWDGKTSMRIVNILKKNH